MWLRRLEWERSTLIGLTGALFAARREVCDPWDASVDSDFATALSCVRHGKAAVSDPQVRCIYRDLGDDRREYQRKVRTVLRGMDCLWRNRQVMNPFRNGLVSWQLISHKAGRYIAPWCMLGLLLSTVIWWIIPSSPSLILQSMMGMLLIAQLLFYFCAFVGYLFPALRRFKLIRVVTFFVMANTAVSQAGLMYICGRRIHLWDPSSQGGAKHPANEIKGEHV
jgi:hypothetical protein